MKKHVLIDLVASLIMLTSITAHSAIKKVPAQFPTIQAAVDASVDGDVIRVSPGTYAENLMILEKAVSLIATDGATRTRIDAGNRGRAITISDSGAKLLTISGFEIVNGNRTWDDLEGIVPGFGGGIYATRSNVKIVDNVITGNIACLGMGIAIQDSRVTLQRNHISHNLVRPGCGSMAVFVQGHRADESQIIENVISEHMALGLQVDSAGRVLVASNVFKNNDARTEWYMGETGGMNSSATELTLRNNLFVGNAGAAFGGAAINFSDHPDFTIVIQSNSFSNNTGEHALHLAVEGIELSDHRITKNLFDNSGGGMPIVCSYFMERDNVFTDTTFLERTSCPFRQ